MTPPPPRTRSHLLASGLALLLAGASVAAGVAYSQRLELRYVHALAPEFHSAKVQGVALQRLAFTQPDLLPLYGSSEVVKEMPNNPREFFAEYRTGFTVFAVGKPGATSLTAAQKLGAVGTAMKGQKFAYSISPGWFFTEVFDPKYYEGNFSEIQVTKLVYSSALSHDLRRDLSRRMIEYPRTLESRPFLDFALHCLAEDTTFSRALYHFAWPLGQLNSAIATMQDHAEISAHILEEEERLRETPERRPQRVAWNDVLKKAIRFANKKAVLQKRNEVARRHLPRASRDRSFQQTIAKAREWVDLELLLRITQELGGDPLLLSMPVEDIRLEVYGISAEARAAYNDRLARLAEKYHCRLIDFHEFEKDPSFTVDFMDHISGSGWLYYNRALDDFYHGRLPKL